MVKRWMGLAAVIALALSMLLTACGNGNSGGSSAQAENGASAGGGDSGTKQEDAKPVTIKIMQYSPEISDAMHALADEYHKEFPNVTLDIEIHQDDYNTLLKSRINAGDLPDIFMTSAYNDNITYKDYSYDLTDEPFMKDIVDSAKTGVTLDGKILGYPFILQSYSFIYNKKLFADAGITELPKTYSQLADVAEKLKAKGITPFANGYKEWWVLEQSFTPELASHGGNYQQLFADINSGKTKLSDIPETKNVFDLLDVTMKYSNPKPLETDFNSSVALFAQGKAAILHQGSWAEDSIRQINKDIDSGFLPHPVGEDPAKAGLMVDSNITWRIYKDSPNLQEALKFFNWLTTSDYGKKFIPTVVKQISTIKDAPFPDSQLAQDTSEFLKNGVTYPWVKGYWPDGYEQQAGQILQKYLAGADTRDQALKELDDTWTKLVNAKKQ